jgi:hypothetical protein
MSLSETKTADKQRPVGPFRMTRPCDSCPFRTDVGGYLTRGRAREIATALLSDQTFHCHKTVDYSADEGEGDTTDSQHCAGAMILLEKVDRPNQMMRICERLGVYDRRRMDMDAPVFDTFAQFIAHHGARRGGGR